MSHPRSIFSREVGILLALTEGLLTSVVSALQKLSPENVPSDGLSSHAHLGQYDRVFHLSRIAIEGLTPSLVPQLRDLLLALQTAIQRLVDGDKSLGLLSFLWVIWGCLQMRCTCPVSLLDPSLVILHKIRAAELEVYPV